MIPAIFPDDRLTVLHPVLKVVNIFFIRRFFMAKPINHETNKEGEHECFGLLQGNGN
jgi:hypothetical protein